MSDLRTTGAAGESVVRRAGASPRCALCGGREVRPVRRLSRGYRLLGCRACGCQFCDPMTPLSGEGYSGAADVASNARHSGPTGWYPVHPSRDSKAFRAGEDRLLLDVGCGNGAFAAFAAERGFRVVGLDFDRTSLDVARARAIPGAEFHCCALDEYLGREELPGRFDVVTMFEVFEHFDRPAAALETVGRLLKPGGLFAGSLPDVGRWFMWRLHMDYEMPPYHLTYWTPRSWAKAVESRYEFGKVQTEPVGIYGYATSTLLDRRPLPAPLRWLLAEVVHRVEFKLEKKFQAGASFYFESIKR